MNGKRQQGNLSSVARTGEEADLGWRWSGLLGWTKEVASVSSMPSRVPLSSSSPMPAYQPHSPTLLPPPRDPNEVAVVYQTQLLWSLTARTKRNPNTMPFSIYLATSLVNMPSRPTATAPMHSAFWVLWTVLCQMNDKHAKCD